MRYLRVALAGLLALSGHVLFAQHCGTVEYIKHLDEKYPGLMKHVDDMYLQSIQETEQKSLYKLAPYDTLFTVDVVFHVVYLQNNQNIPDSLILDQLAVLNEAFNRLNADTVNTRDIFKPVAGNARIKFRFANVDPDGNPTNGITRTQSNRSTFNTNNNATTTDYVKQSAEGGHDAWDTKKYLNIWICNLNLQNGQRALFGYAYPPVGATFWSSTYYKSDPFQGVVLHYETIGRNNPSFLSDQLYTNEKTAIHEVGHYFGLRHVWGDANWGQNGCLVDDYIFDTPNTYTRASGCDKSLNTCSTDNLPDQVENYMDYSSAVCSNMFTQRQVDVMRYNMVNLRSELPSSEYVGPVRTVAEGNYLFPNPVADHWSVAFDDPINEEVTVELYDMLGRMVYQAQVVANNYTAELPVAGVSIGMYRAIVTSAEHGVIVDTNILKAQ